MSKFALSLIELKQELYKAEFFLTELGWKHFGYESGLVWDFGKKRYSLLGALIIFNNQTLLLGDGDVKIWPLVNELYQKLPVLKAVLVDFGLLTIGEWLAKFYTYDGQAQRWIDDLCENYDWVPLGDNRFGVVDSFPSGVV